VLTHLGPARLNQLETSRGCQPPVRLGVIAWPTDA